ncbi:hypothetical protein D3C86_938240 [compost metagenome]
MALLRVTMLLLIRLLLRLQIVRMTKQVRLRLRLLAELRLVQPSRIHKMNTVLQILAQLLSFQVLDIQQEVHLLLPRIRVLA